MSPTASQPQILLVHDGELADLRPLLEAIGAPFVERQGALAPGASDPDCELIVATPRRMLEVHLDPSSSSPPVRIAVLEQDTRTLRNSLRRAGIQSMVRRPVHPAAIRALLLHALYRGPEKRRSPRVSVGARVRVRVGWRSRPAVLTDLSLGGCRLLVDQPLERNALVTLLVPAAVARGKAFSIKARVLRCASAPEAAEGSLVATARFEQVTRRRLPKLKATVAAHSDGPAVFEGPCIQAPAPAVVDAPVGVDANPGVSAPPGVEAPPDAPGGIVVPFPEPVAAEAPSAAPPERREVTRGPMDQRVVGLHDEAARVLMGREISVGGMRVDHNPLLAVGEDVELAIHVGTLDRPLVVQARVHRDDGSRGHVLRFHELSPIASRYLNDLMDGLPLVDGVEDGENQLVAELLQTA